MLVGSGDPIELEKNAPEVEALESPALVLPGVVFFHALFEIETRDMCEMLPPALHPTLPPVAGISIYAAPDSPWGAFRLAQLRI